MTRETSQDAHYCRPGVFIYLRDCFGKCSCNAPSRLQGAYAYVICMIYLFICVIILANAFVDQFFMTALAAPSGKKILVQRSGTRQQCLAPRYHSQI
jgi:hypothetical protein